MKAKGFTLVELLGVIVILAIIFTLISPTVTNIIVESRQTVYQKQIKAILNAAYDFTLQHLNYLPEDDSANSIILGQLKHDGFVDVDIKNPESDEIFPDNLVISIKKDDNKNHSNDLSMVRGNYLYTVEKDKLSASSSLLPEIILSVEGDTELKKNSDGNYIMTLNLNDEMPKVNVSATYSKTSSVDLTNEIKQYILKSGVINETINTSTPAIYKINYSVVNSEGYASLVVLNIIIGDKIPPTIILPELATHINKEITNYDLEEGIKCEDNSGVCEFTYNDTIEYGHVGTYTITYTAKDPSGNTNTQERAIIVE